MKSLFGAALGLGLLLSAPTRADEIRLIGTGAVKHTITGLIDSFKAKTGHSVSAGFATAGVVTSRIEAGEPADVVISSKASIATLAKSGKVVGEARDLGEVRIAVAVRAGAPAPDVSTPEALKAALLAAPIVSYGDPAAGATTGIHFAKVLQALGVADHVNKTANLQKDGLDVMQEVASGRATLGITQASEVKSIPGVVLAGFLPPEHQLVSTYTAAVTPAGEKKEAAAAFLAYITGPEGKAAFKAIGFDVK